MLYIFLILIQLTISFGFIVHPHNSGIVTTTTTVTTTSSAHHVLISSSTSHRDLQHKNEITKLSLSSSSSSANQEDESFKIPILDTFREAEILGLKLMQEGKHEQALEVFQKGLKLPGSRTDIIRTQKISGPSPVGGSSGGTEGRVVQTLDEFELQAAHYNIACAYARLGKSVESCQNLEQAFQSGFDNFNTVRADPDLSDVHGTLEFDTLMEKWDPKRGFNPFGFFKK